MEKSEVREAGIERGKGIASWVDIPEIGDKVDRSVDWFGLGDTVTGENLFDYCVMLAMASEENDRQFSPFEFTAKELNEAEDSEELWTAFDEGISTGIARELNSRGVCSAR